MRKIITILSTIFIITYYGCNQDPILENMNLQNLEKVNDIEPFFVFELFVGNATGRVSGMNDAYYIGEVVARTSLQQIQRYFDCSIAFSNLGQRLLRQGIKFYLAIDKKLSNPKANKDAYYDSYRHTIFFKDLICAANEYIVLHEVLHLFQSSIGNINYTNQNELYTEFEVLLMHDVLKCIAYEGSVENTEGGTSPEYKSFVRDLASGTYTSIYEEYVLQQFEKFYRIKCPYSNEPYYRPNFLLLFLNSK